jgi:cobalt-zinc-cadmium efflux system protein
MVHTHDHDTEGNIQVAFLLNLFFALFELVGALLTNSLALLSSGLHDFGDTLSLGLSLILNKLAKKDRTPTFTYGYRRLSLLAAFLNSLILIVGAMVVFFEAIPRLMQPQHSNADGMFIFAIIGLAVNSVAYIRLKAGKTMSEKVAALHLLDDVLALGAVLIISVVIKFYDLHILDPLLSIVITLYVLWNVIKNFKKTINLFLQAAPDNMNITKLEADIKSISNVLGIHDTHVWSLDGEHNILSTHIVVKDDASHEEMVEIKCQAKLLISKEQIQHSTVEIECENEKCDIHD